MMKRNILLIDDSLTVQKVVALTLDKNLYEVHYAKTRTEAIKGTLERTPDVILISDSFRDIHWQSFPKEVEAWLARNYDLPAIILITSQDIAEAKHYAGVLRKPFTPQILQSMVAAFTPGIDEDDKPTQLITKAALDPDEADRKLQKTFNDTFASEEKLMEKTFQMQKEEESMKPNNDLWSVSASSSSSVPAVLGSGDSMAYKAVLENKVEQELVSKDLDAIVNNVLSRLVPPIVERLVQERLDQLMREQEGI
jgi:CheY-like chemotaxis protein